VTDSFSYVSVLTSIVLALCIARVFAGVGKLLQLRGRVRICWIHLLWALNLFLYLVLNWWILYRWRGEEHWTFFLFLFVLLSPSLTYLLSVLLFPDPLEAGTDLKGHFFSNHRRFFSLAMLVPLLDAADTYLKGWEHFLAQGPIYFVTIGLLFVLMAVAALSRRVWFHAFFAVFFLVYLLAFITINLRVLT